MHVGVFVIAFTIRAILVTIRIENTSMPILSLTSAMFLDPATDRRIVVCFKLSTNDVKLVYLTVGNNFHWLSMSWT